MTDSRPPRTIRVDALARVEGEGALTIHLEGDRAKAVQLRIFEPPRFFEAFLRGRSQLEAPDITARICGICPVAYQMSACHAIEAAHGIRPDGAIRALRRLLYCGEWIESHALHVFMLHLPDFLGYPDALSLAKDHPGKVKAALRMKKAGNAIVAAVGGREIHPVNVRVGGFYRAPHRRELAALVPELEACRELAAEAMGWLADLPFPDFERDYEFVALSHPDEYPLNEGRLVSSKGLDIAPGEYDDHFEEIQVEYSNALQSRIRGRGAYFCGPLARFNLNSDKLRPVAREAALSAGLVAPCHNPFKGILARGVEVLNAFDEAVALIRDYQPPEVPHYEIPESAATGRAITEAPRGILYHRYTTDAGGLITDAKIVPPTSQNQRSMEEDLFVLAPRLAALPLEEATLLAEQSVRNYDPCISCATHLLRLEIVREPGRALVLDSTANEPHDSRHTHDSSRETGDSSRDSARLATAADQDSSRETGDSSRDSARLATAADQDSSGETGDVSQELRGDRDLHDSPDPRDRQEIHGLQEPWDGRDSLPGRSPRNP